MDNESRAMRSTAILSGLLLLALALPGWGQSGGSYEIRRASIDAGGSRSTGGNASLSGTVAQPDASLQTSEGGEFSLTGGIWARGRIEPPPGRIFADGFESP